MKVLVPVKRVIDPYVTIHVKSDETGVVTDNVKMSINPFDEIAVEEAVRWSENGVATDVVAITVGVSACQETLRHALAMGASSAIHIETDQTLEPLAIAQVLSHIVSEQSFDMVIMGKQAIDDDCNQTGQMLAGLLDWSQGTFASKVTVEQEHVTLVREIDGGLESLKLTRPCVLTTDLRLNEPRYLSMPNIMKAKRKTIEIIPLSSLDLSLVQQQNVLAVKAPAAKAPGRMVESVDALVTALVEEEQVLP